MSLRIFLALAAIAFTAALGLVWLTPSRAAEECLSVEQDKAHVEERGAIEYLGPRPMPFTDGIAIFYRHPSGLTIASPVIDGCVAPKAYPVGRYKAEAGA